MSKLKAISLFSGAGGMDVGFEKAGVEVVWANEINKEAAETYRLNHPETTIVNDDLNNQIASLKRFENEVDLVFGGPPCQGFSVAGKMDPNDERSQLVWSFLEVVKVTQPRAFVLENVKALAKLDKWSEVRKKIYSTSQDLGYTCFPFLLNATEYGVPQKRERVFFIGIKNDLFFEDEMKYLLEKNKKVAKSIKETLVDLGVAGTPNNPNTCTAKITFATNPVMRKTAYSGMYFNGQGRPINIDGYANTLPASMGGNKTPFVDEEYLYGNAESNWVEEYHEKLVNGYEPKFNEAPSRLRRITIKEASRIQTFPDEYIFFGSKGKIYTQIGNAVPCELAFAVAKAVTDYLES
ncbi:DNA cytosine methyltransferase [Streptococcus parasanguinis]|uniref:DNA cytosine methyltransferase n=1 Tax=Streptococcus parasanguinis TaxID=1318 RepID=UPI002025227C|nr:DNA cytosine methyltransferase [Streptococcus parasanguinis]